jgi:hypothetical protein
MQLNRAGIFSSCALESLQPARQLILAVRREKIGASPWRCTNLLAKELAYANDLLPAVIGAVGRGPLHLTGVSKTGFDVVANRIRSCAAQPPGK